jgi:hypothetical protein
MSKMVIDSLISSFQDPLHWQKTLEVSTVNITLGKVVYLGIAFVMSYVRLYVQCPPSPLKNSLDVAAKTLTNPICV